MSLKLLNKWQKKREKLCFVFKRVKTTLKLELERKRKKNSVSFDHSTTKKYHL